MTKLLDDIEAAARLTNAPGTLRNWRSSRLDGPAFIKIGRLVRYREEDIERYIESRRVEGVQLDNGR